MCVIRFSWLLYLHGLILYSLWCKLNHVLVFTIEWHRIHTEMHAKQIEWVELHPLLSHTAHSFLLKALLPPGYTYNKVCVTVTHNFTYNRPTTSIKSIMNMDQHKKKKILLAIPVPAWYRQIFDKEPKSVGNKYNHVMSYVARGGD